MPTVNDIFRGFYPGYLSNHRPSFQQAKVARNIVSCRTAKLGGHVSICEECGHLTVHHNSCRDRHCPLCQGVNKTIWVDQKCRDILNAPYFHVVFTMPEELQTVIYRNQELLYDLMFKSVAKTLFALCRDPKHLGAEPGFFCVLHTWGQDLHYHPHIHVVIMAGGLTAQNKWKSSSKKFFIPVRVLSKLFRGKYLDQLKQYYHAGQLNFQGDNTAFQELLNECYAKNWYSYCRETFGGPKEVIKYLGRYTQRIAIGNSRILAVNEESVTFKVRDKQDAKKAKTCTLPGIEFVRRFLMHVLPKGFVKVRSYGLMATRNKTTKLALCRKLTQSPSYHPQYEGMTVISVLCKLLGRDVTKCPCCQNNMRNLPLAFSP